MKAEIKMITPEIAGELLKLNTNNRPLCHKTVALYANKMRSGLWYENGESIVITDKPRLGSGQHRLHAVIQCGIAFRAVVVTGVSDIAFPTLDMGKGRTSANILSCAGYKNSVKIAAAISAIQSYNMGKRSKWSGTDGPDVVAQAVETYGDLTEFISLAEKVRKNANGRASIFTAAFYLMNFFDRDLMLDFAEKVATGIGLSRGDPELLLRSRVMRDSTENTKLGRADYAALVALAVNAKLKKRPLFVLKYNEESDFPVIG